jgi:hypothetical protein
MSSVTSSYAQISKRTKFFLVVGTDISGYVVDGLNSVIVGDLPGNTTITVDGALPGSVTVNTLLKDLGREIVCVESAATGDSSVTQIYRQVQRVGGAATEGVGGSYPATGSGSYYDTFYVKVFDAAGTGVRVVRTG